jgi:hypothetical protein
MRATRDLSESRSAWGVLTLFALFASYAAIVLLLALALS